MKKAGICALVLLLILTGGSGGIAELDRSAYTIASGTVCAVNFEDVTAPWSGTLLPFDWEPGDRVSAEETLFQVQQQIVRSPVSGVVSAVFAEQGMDCTAVASRFGCLAAIEPEYSYLIQATTSGAYNKSKNRELHLGETLYFKQSSGDNEEGSGVVIAVSGESYTVEIRQGAFHLRDNLSLYRSSSYNASDKVGTGIVFRRDPMLISAAGRISEVFLRPGDTVRPDQPLLALLPADADPGTAAVVSCPHEGIIASLGAQPGQQVWKGQLLARVCQTDALEVVAEVDEMDLPRIRVGDVCPVLLDMDENTVLEGQITEISGLGLTRQNAAYYQVHLSLGNAGTLPLGASASVYLPKAQSSQ